MPFCPSCGVEIKGEDAFCSNCGHAISSIPSPRPTYVQPRMTPRTPQRPTGVTILAILEALLGLLSLGGGALALIGATYIGSNLPSGVPEFFSGMVGVMGGILIIIGLLNFILSYGFWTGKGWSWTIGIIVTGLGLVINIVSLPNSIISLIINAIIIYYLTRPYVKQYFGK